VLQPAGGVTGLGHFLALNPSWLHLPLVCLCQPLFLKPAGRACTEGGMARVGEANQQQQVSAGQSQR
jgi:hypothetical protein